MFWAPLGFSLRREWWVWYVVVWADGHRERSDEDCPPRTVVAEMQVGSLAWDTDDVHRGQYTVQWLPEPKGEAALADLRITPDDF